MRSTAVDPSDIQRSPMSEATFLVPNTQSHQFVRALNDAYISLDLNFIRTNL